MNVPELQEAVAILEQLAGSGPIDVTVPISELEIDSLDLLEWAYNLEEETGVTLDASFADQITGEMTLSEIYGLVGESLTVAVAASN